LKGSGRRIEQALKTEGEEKPKQLTSDGGGLEQSLYQLNLSGKGRNLRGSRQCRGKEMGIVTPKEKPPEGESQ